MPRANRYYVSGYVWHLTHRCIDREFLLRHRKDRRRWLFWLSAARRRYGLRVLNYIVTCNHVHVLVYDQGRGEIARSMQLVAGRTAQEYNRRKKRRGPYWEDRYHATAVSSDRHLIACMRYIDLNMVRAGVVRHPKDWSESGYCAIQRPAQRYRIIDLDLLTRLVGCRDLASLQKTIRNNVALALNSYSSEREPIWSESVAVGDEAFIASIRSQLGEQTGRPPVRHLRTSRIRLEAEQPGGSSSKGPPARACAK